MVHVDIGPGLVVTCGRLVEGGLWKEIPLTVAIGHYYNSKGLNEPLNVSDLLFNLTCIFLISDSIMIMQKPC